MTRLKVGDPVRISSREVRPDDIKSGLFFSHFRGLRGSVQKVYAGGQVAVSVDLDSLPEEMWRRHMTTRDRMRDAWLKGMAEDVRRKLTPEQKRFDLSYVVLVSQADLERPGGRKPKTTAAV
jgi:hypothetical protein